MNKTDVIAALATKTTYANEVCRSVIDALEDVSGNIFLARMKGHKLNEPAAVAEISAKSGENESVCEKILVAFEEVFNEELSNKFRFGSRKK